MHCVLDILVTPWFPRLSYQAISLLIPIHATPYLPILLWGHWTLKAGFTQGITSLGFLQCQIRSAVLLRSTYACERMSEFYRRIYRLFFHSYIFSIVLRNANIKLFIYFLIKEEIGILLINVKVMIHI